MHEITVSYKNTDGLFRHDEAIREAMSRWPGEETDSGQDLETHMRHITYAFEDEGDDSAAIVDLEELLGDRFREITYMGKPEEPESTTLIIGFDHDQPWIPREIVSVLTFDLCSGWKHLEDLGEHFFFVECPSLAAARHLKATIDTRPLGRWVDASFCPDEVSQAALSIN